MTGTVIVNGYVQNYYVTDPFGWRGATNDPLLDFGVGHTSSCLWRSRAEGLVASCADILLYEDGGITGGRSSHFSWNHGWTVLGSNRGNGYHAWGRDTTYQLPEPPYHEWYDPNWDAWAPAGIYEVLIFRPWYTNAATTSAGYTITILSGTTTVTVDQSVRDDRWYSAGTYVLPAGDIRVKLTSNTSDSGRKIYVDGIKVRSYQDLAPAIHYNYSYWP